MKKITHLFFTVSLLLLIIIIGSSFSGPGTVIYDESASGDLTNTGDGPILNLNSTGAFVVKGSLQTPGDNQDRFQINVAAGFQITSIFYSITGGNISGGISFGPFGAGASAPGSGELSLAPYTAFPAGTYSALAFADFSAGSTWSVIFIVDDAPIAPIVTTQPANDTVCLGNIVSFTSNASGSPDPSIQWQESPDNGFTWTDIPGANSPTYTFTPTLAQNGYQYSAVFTNTAGENYSDAATVVVNTPTTVTSSPSDETVTVGSKVTFIATVSGMPKPTAQWQVSGPGQSSFFNIPGATSDTLTFTAMTSQNNSLYRVVYTNVCSVSITSAVILKVTSTLPIAITSFDINKLSGKSVLKWSDAQEINCKGFEILHGKNESDFNVIGWKEAQGTSSLSHSYEYFDENPYKGVNYYRLRMRDNDGNYTLSNIKAITFQEDNKFSVFPNPVHDELSITTGKPGSIRITDLSGKEIIKKQSISAALKINLKQLNPGVYMVEFITDEGNEMKKIVKY